MRFKSAQLYGITALICVLSAVSVDAGFLGDVFGGDSSSPSATGTTQPPSTTTTQPATNPPGQAPNNPGQSQTTKAILPLPTIPGLIPTNSTSSLAATGPSTPTSPSTPVSPGQSASRVKQYAGPRQSTNATSIGTDTMSATPSATSSNDDQNSNNSSSGNTTAVIIGSVCAFVAVICVGFGFAFFSKTRRNNRKKRLQEDTPPDPSSEYNYNHPANPSPFDARPAPSPAMAAAAADYVKAPPQEMEYAHANDAYYSPPMPNTALAPMANYPDAGISGAYYAQPPPQPQPYYYEPQHDPNQYYAYNTAAPGPTPVMHSASPPGPVYSAPNAYDDRAASPMGTPQQHHQQPVYQTPYYHPMGGGEPYR